MPEHLTGERLSALLADDDPTDEERSHLEGCPACEAELRRMRRMRMALSALDDLEAPDGGWERIHGALPDRRAEDRAAGDVEPARGEPSDRRGPRTGWSFGGAWVRAAAAVVLFAGGLAVGTRLSGPGGGADTPAPAGEAAGERVAAEASPGDETQAAGTGGSEAAEGAPARAAAGGGQADASTEAGDFASAAGLTDVGEPTLEAYRDPAAAAERLARLDAMMQAAREAIRQDPSDPAVNDLLFRVAEDRQALIEALHLATLEYR